MKMRINNRSTTTIGDLHAGFRTRATRGVCLLSMALFGAESKAAGLSPEEIDVPAAGGTYPVTVTVDEETHRWTTLGGTFSPDWIEPGYGTGSATVQLIVPGHTTLRERNFNWLFQVPSPGLQSPGRLDVTQAGAAPFLNVSTTEITASYEGETIVIPVTCNPDMNWTAEWDDKDRGLPGLLRSGGDGSGEIRLDFSPNYDPTPLVGTFEIRSIDDLVPQQIVLPISVVQEASPPRTSIGTRQSEVSHAGVTYPLSIRSNESWSIAGMPGWVNVAPSSGQGTTAVYITVEPNAGIERTTQLSINSNIHTIIQDAFAPVVWGQPQSIDYGSALSGDQLNATPFEGQVGTFIYDPPVGTILNAGTHTLRTSFIPSDANLDPVTASVLLEVTPAPLTITADDQSRLPNSPNPAMSVTYAGFVNGDTDADLDLQPIATTSATIESEAGDYPIVVEGARDSNYVIDYREGNLQVGAFLFSRRPGDINAGSGPMKRLVFSSSRSWLWGWGQQFRNAYHLMTTDDESDSPILATIRAEFNSQGDFSVDRAVFAESSRLSGVTFSGGDSAAEPVQVTPWTMSYEANFLTGDLRDLKRDLALDGSTLAVGQIEEQLSKQVGRVFVYDLEREDYPNQEPVLEIRDPIGSEVGWLSWRSKEWFGQKVALSGRNLVVVAGGPIRPRGELKKFYVFNLESSDPQVPIGIIEAVFNPFSECLALSEQYLVVADPGEGIVCVFDLNSDTPTVPMLKLTGDESTFGFGEGVALSGSTLVVYQSNSYASGTLPTLYFYDLASDSPSLPIANYTHFRALSTELPRYERFSMAIKDSLLVTSDQYSLLLYDLERPPEIRVETGAGTGLTYGENQFDFGTAVVNTDLHRTFTVKNLGLGDLTQIEATITEDAAGAFRVISAPETRVAAKSQAGFTVAFTPSDFGEHSAKLQVKSDDADEGSYVIALTGKGVEEPSQNPDFEEAVARAGLVGDNATPEAMPFKDGVSNLLKFAFNLNLADRYSRSLDLDGNIGLPIFSLANMGDQSYWQATYLRRKNTGLTYTPERSNTLGPATFVPMTGIEYISSIDAIWERVTVSDPCDPATERQCFGRVKVTMRQK